MAQNPITVVTEVKSDLLAELIAYLEPIGNDIKNNNIIQFSTFQNLHYCCFIIIKDENPPIGTQKAKPLLVFEANIDGSVKDFLNDLCAKAPDFMRKAFSYCVGCPASHLDLPAYVLKNSRRTNTFYIAHPGQTKEVIEFQRGLRQKIEDYIDTNRQVLVSLPPKQIKENIIKHLTTLDPEFPNKRPLPTSFFVKYGEIIFKSTSVIAGVALIAILFTAIGWIGSEGFQLFSIVLLSLIFGFLLLFAIWLRWRERPNIDIQDERISWNSNYIDKLQTIEDRQLQNHLSSIVYVKGGRLRLATLAVVLFFINIVAKVKATKGNLSGIVTIHFARWVILPGQTNERSRLLFFSNYDGSWENYLGEFIDHASPGLTAIWTNTESTTNRGFPDTQWLVKGGARDEQRFKAYARNSQRSEMIWYSAYPDLSVKNVGNNQKIHIGLFSDEDLAVWLQRF